MSPTTTKGAPVTLEQLAQEDRARSLERRYAKVVRAARKGD